MKDAGRILIVDDEEDIRALLSTYLSRINYVTETAIDGHEGLQKYLAGEYDLVISDMVMPRIDGLELLQRIRKADPDALFIMITGFPTIETAVKAIKEGAYDYITKPFNLEDVKLCLGRAFEKKYLSDQLRAIKGFNWALVLSIPLWLVLGIILALIFK
jgi:two-component system response regulator PilR (NtrC family)